MIYRRRFIDSVSTTKTNYIIEYNSYDDPSFTDYFIYKLNIEEVAYAIKYYLSLSDISLKGDNVKIYKAFNNITTENLNNILDDERVIRALKEYCLNSALKAYKGA